MCSINQVQVITSNTPCCILSGIIILYKLQTCLHKHVYSPTHPQIHLVSDFFPIFLCVCVFVFSFWGASNTCFLYFGGLSVFCSGVHNSPSTPWAITFLWWKGLCVQVMLRAKLSAVKNWLVDGQFPPRPDIPSAFQWPVMHKFSWFSAGMNFAHIRSAWFYVAPSGADKKMVAIATL